MQRRQILSIFGVTSSSLAGCLSLLDDSIELRLTNNTETQWKVSVKIETREERTLYTGDFTVEPEQQEGDEFEGNPLTVYASSGDGTEEELRVDPQSEFYQCDYEDLYGLHVIRMSDGEVILRHFC